MSISTFKIKQYKLAPTVTVLSTHSFACMNMCLKPFYVHENQCMQILYLLSPEIKKFNNTWAVYKCIIHFYQKEAR